MPASETLDHAAIKKHRKSVEHIARSLIRKLPSNIEIDDLIQEGMIALWKSSRTYDVSQLGKNVCADTEGAFFSYASSRVRGAMMDYLRSTDVLSRDDRRRAKLLSSLLHDHEVQGTKVSVQEAAEKLGVEKGEIFNLLRLKAMATETAAAVGNDDESMATAEASLTDHSAIEHEIVLREISSQITPMSALMNPTEQRIFKVWLSGDGGYSLIAEDMGVTPSRVSQLLRDLIKKLPDYFETAATRDLGKHRRVRRKTPMQITTAPAPENRPVTKPISIPIPITAKQSAPKLPAFHAPHLVQERISVASGTLWG